MRANTLRRTCGCSTSNHKFPARGKMRRATMPRSRRVMSESLLRAINIDKSFAGVHALKRASFELQAGEVHALIGENGAGKSTLIKIITGAVAPDAGEIHLNGKLVTHNSPRLAKQLGIAVMYQ